MDEELVNEEMPTDTKKYIYGVGCVIFGLLVYKAIYNHGYKSAYADMYKSFVKNVKRKD